MENSIGELKEDLGDKLCDYCTLEKKGVYGVDGGYMAGCEGSCCDDAYDVYLEQLTDQPQEKEWWIGMLHQVQFVDYEENQWTVPVKLTQERLDKIKDDHSVTAIKLLPNTVIKS